ncbi:uncharacterized protein LOC142025234 isoform X1 [Carettochelys insculpta]|uniref:uncharacterized protein LOC142025234 isoform X1 n=1 Tax=Carettochelys insculpta TaxID=44489 RepID=UPI003EBB56C5
MGEKANTCPYCGKGFRRTSHLTRHLGTHSGRDQRPYPCSHRSKSSALALQPAAAGERPYTCTHCGKTFGRSAHLARHQETHSGERPYKCTYCGKAFGRNAHLTRHHGTHTGERPYQCGICGRAFTRDAHLTRHQLVHTGEKPFQCSVCGKAFTRSAHLARHQGTHTGSCISGTGGSGPELGSCHPCPRMPMQAAWGAHSLPCRRLAIQLYLKPCLDRRRTDVLEQQPQLGPLLCGKQNSVLRESLCPQSHTPAQPWQ